MGGFAMVLPIATILLPWDHPPTPIICVRQTLNLVTLHLSPLNKPYFIVFLRHIHDQAIITLNAGICDATPHCYYFIALRLPTHSICVHQTLNLVALHFLPLTEPYFIVVFHRIRYQAIITLICDATPRCYILLPWDHPPTPIVYAKP